MLRLRAIEPTDLELLYSLENDADLVEHSCGAAPLSRYALKQFIQRSAQTDVYESRQLRLVVDEILTPSSETPLALSADVVASASSSPPSVSRAVALVDLFDFQPRHHRAEVGIVVLPEHRQRTIGKQSLQLLANYAAQQLSLNQLYAYVQAENVASLALFQSSGYKLSGRLTDWFYYANRYRDAFLLQCQLR